MCACEVQGSEHREHREERVKPQSLFASAAEGALLTREEAKALTDKILSYAKADETRINISNDFDGNTRFAGGAITTSGTSTDTTVTVISTIGRRQASATTNVLEEASLKRTVDLAERLARLSPEDPEIMPGLGPQNYSAVNGFLESTAALTPEARADAVKKVIDNAAAAGSGAGNLFVAGFLETNAGVNVIANNKGLFAYHR